VKSVAESPVFPPMTHSNTPWPAYDWTGKIVVVTGGVSSRSCIVEPARATTWSAKVASRTGAWYTPTL